MTETLFETPRLRCRRWMPGDIEAIFAVYGMFALEDRDSGEVVGFCGLVHPGDQPDPEIEYAFLQSCWGKGLGSEAVSGLLAFGASQFGMRSIIATVAPENLASQRVLSKAGARRTEVRPDDDGTDTYVFEWLAPSANRN